MTASPRGKPWALPRQLNHRLIAAVQDLLFLTAFPVDLLEVAHDFVDGTHDGEGLGVAADDVGQLCHLALVDHADEHGDFPAGVQALGGDHGGRMVELLDDLLADLLGVVGDDLEADSGPAGLGHAVGNGGGHVAVENAQQHGLDLVVIDEVAGQGHGDIQGEDDVEHVGLGTVLVDQSRHEVRAAGIGAAAHQHGVACAEDDTAHQGAQDGGGAVFRVVGDAGQVHLFQHHQHDTEDADIEHGAHGQALADLQIHHDGQGDVDEQGHVADADAGDVLDHGADAVQARRGELVREDEQMIIQRRDHGHGTDDHIGQRFLCLGLFHDFPSFQWWAGRPCQILPASYHGGASGSSRQGSYFFNSFI